MVELSEGTGKIVLAVIVALIVVLAFGASYAVISGYGVKAAGGAQETLKVGCVYYTKGKYMEISEDIYKGLQLWAEDVNKLGGIKAGDKVYTVELVCEQIDPTITSVVTTYKTMISTQGVQVLVGPPGNEQAKAVIEVAEANGVPVILTFTDDDALFTTERNYTFQIMTPAFRTVDAVFKTFQKYNVSFKGVAVLYQHEAYTAANLTKPRPRHYADTISNYVRNLPNVTLAFKDKFTQANLTGVVNTMYASATGIDIVFIVAEKPDLTAQAVQQVVSKGGAGLKYVVVISQAPAIVEIEKTLTPAQLSKVLYVSMWEPTAALSPFMAANLGVDWYGFITSEAFVTGYYSKYGVIPNDMAAMGYQAGLTIQMGVEKAGTVDADAVAKAILNSKVMTFYGLIGFGGSIYYAGGFFGYQMAHDPVIVTYQESGGQAVKVIVWPTYLATGTLG